MKANELRLGNYVSVAGHSDPIRIEALSLDPTFGQCIVWWSDPVSKHIADMGCVSPIPLTEELLLKCGFEKETMDFRNGGSADIYDNRGVLLASVGCSFRFCTWSENTDYSGLDLEYIGAAISYLHQIQNLYFALVGEEFEVKLD